MDGKQIAAVVFGMIFKVVVAGIVIMLVYKFAISAYTFGYEVFADVPVAAQPGQDVSVAVVEGKSVMEVAGILKEKGLIKDEKMFYVQERLSEYHGKFQPGIFTLNTSMSAREMMEIMSATADGEDTEGEDTSGGEVTKKDTAVEDANQGTDTKENVQTEDVKEKTADDKGTVTSDENPDVTQEEE